MKNVHTKHIIRQHSVILTFNKKRLDKKRLSFMLLNVINSKIVLTINRCFINDTPLITE